MSSASPLDIIIVDWEGFLPKIREQLNEQGVIQVGKSIKVPYFKLRGRKSSFRLIEEDLQYSACHVVFISYNSSFDNESLDKLEKWIAEHPRESFMVVAFNIPPKSWKVLTATKWKVEEDFAKRFPDTPLCVVKFVPEDRKQVTETDINAIRTAIGDRATANLKARIIELVEGETAKTNSMEMTCRLSLILVALGNCRQAIQYHSSLKFAESSTFWPESPVFYDLMTGAVGDSACGYSLIVTSIAGLLRYGVNRDGMDPVFEYVTRCFAIMIDNCVTDEHKIFASHMIHYIAATLADAVEKKNRDTCAIFSRIALVRAMRLCRVKPDWDNKFLANIPENRRDPQAIEEMFLGEWGRLKALMNGRKRYTTFISAVLFDHLQWKDDRQYAVRVANDYQGSSGADLFVMRTAESLYRWAPDKRLASILVSSYAQKGIKMEALTLLKKAYPSTAIRAVVRAPKMFGEIPLFSSVHFDVEFSPPSFIVGEKVTVHVKCIGEREQLLAEPQELVLDHRTLYQSTINCRRHDVYSRFVLCIAIGELKLRWDLHVSNVMIVESYHNTLTVDLTVPRLIARNPEGQSAILMIDNIDTECKELGILLQSPAIDKIVFNGQEYKENQEIVCTDVSSPRMQIRLFVQYHKSKSIACTCRLVLQDGQEIDWWNSFEVKNDAMNLEVALFDQNAYYQQFQITNRFRASFSVNFDGREHHIRERSTYCIMRKTSEEPLRLLFREDQWEDFPVSLTTAEVQKDVIQLDIELDTSGWVVGEGRTATLQSSASVMNDDVMSNNWIMTNTAADNKKYLMIPRRPGRLEIPMFVVDDQVVDCNITFVDVINDTSPPFVPL